MAKKIVQKPCEWSEFWHRELSAERKENVLPCKTKEALYHAFDLSHFDFCSQIWHHCGARNTRKLERVNKRELRFVYKDKNNSYDRLLNWIGLHSMLEGHIQDMLIVAFRRRHQPPLVSGLFGTSLQRHGMSCRIRFAPWPAQGNF